MRLRGALRFLIGPYCLALAACAGSGAGLDANGRPQGSNGGGGALTATFQSIQDNVFTPICSVCHAGGAAPQGLRLDAVNSYSLLVGVPSTEVGSVLRVKPGDPNNSYIVQKIEGHAAVGAQMPFGGPPLPSATIAVIRQWISDGALHVAAATRADAFDVMSITPAPGDVVLEAPARIIVGFSGELDLTRIDGSSVRLERLAIDGSEATAIAVPADISVPGGNPFALMLTPHQRLANGRYRVLVNGPPATGLSDIGGERLRAATPDGTLSEFSVEANP
jgi:hypothetical protein